MSTFANSLLVLVFFIVPVAVARAATPADELLRLVPEDVGFCLVVQDLRTHSAAFLQSPFFRRLSETGFGPAGAPELAKLADVEKEFKKHLNLDWARLRDDVFGDAVVFAYRPGPPGKPDAEQGLVLVRARDAKLLADLVERLNTLQKSSGDLKEVEEREHQGLKYVRRVEKKQESFYYLKGPVLACSSQEKTLRQAIELDQTASVNEEPPIARQMRLLGVERGLARSEER